MPGIYQIGFKDTSGILQQMLTSWRQLELSREVNGVGGLRLTVDGSLAILDSIDVDWQVEVWRQDLPNSIALYLEYEGFIRGQERTVTGDGEYIATLFGTGYNDLLRRRGIWYAAGSAEAEKSGPGETVMKEYVDENAGPSATSPPRLSSAGTMTGLTIQADGGAGSSWVGARAYRNLLTVCQEIALATSVDFQIVGNGAAMFEFQAQASPLGDDRSTDGLDLDTGLNGAGNPPVVFSLNLGNMQEPRYSYDRRSEINTVLVLGQGIEDDRDVEERQTAAYDDSPWNRCETTRPASLESTASGLQSAGDALLEEVKAVEQFTFEPVQTPSSLYGREYFLGDLITARFAGVELTRKITGIHIQVEGGRETISIDAAAP